MNWLSGKKTYLIAACMVIHALSGLVLGEQPNWTEVMGALGLASLRAGIEKSKATPPPPPSTPTS